jgi:hypothetical protein
MTPERYLTKAERALSSARLLRQDGDIGVASKNRLLRITLI